MNILKVKAQVSEGKKMFGNKAYYTGVFDSLHCLHTMLLYKQEFSSLLHINKYNTMTKDFSHWRKRPRLKCVIPVKQPEKLRADDVIIAIMKLGFFILILGLVSGFSIAMLGVFFGGIVSIVSILYMIGVAFFGVRP